ncbi:cysteine-rich and transmembrane domain-containing protein WIH2-like [Phragmites australis]|uniref:cysteine-rich and transmembrane domain-containing protein WIH2-like n=1 Tax=Phragmites australis TaxID=29695 RepID=UPI002D78A9CF|nr:cysteine-rich and transmembrane domain-containing protein WIH2-like [Phragmites australis]
MSYQSDPYPPPGYPHGYPPQPPPGYQGYFHEQQGPYYPPSSGEYDHDRHEEEDSCCGCSGFLKGCLAALCCCCVLEECCGFF